MAAALASATMSVMGHGQQLDMAFLGSWTLSFVAGAPRFSECAVSQHCHELCGNDELMSCQCLVWVAESVDIVDVQARVQRLVEQGEVAKRNRSTAQL